MRTELTETTFAQIKPTKINLSLIGRFKTMPVYGAEPVPLEHARNGKDKTAGRRLVSLRKNEVWSALTVSAP